MSVSGGRVRATRKLEQLCESIEEDERERNRFLKMILNLVVIHSFYVIRIGAIM